MILVRIVRAMIPSVGFVLASTMCPWSSGQCEPQWLPEFPLGEVGTNVKSACMFDEDGDGPADPVLYVGGQFDINAIKRVARWNGISWEPVGAGFADGGVFDLEVFDADGDGPGLPRLYAGGTFDASGTETIRSIAMWNGTAWEQVGVGVTGGYVNSMCVFDDDHDPKTPSRLFVAGSFGTAGGMPIKSIARWDGTQWSSLGSGLVSGSLVYAVAVHDDGQGPKLIAGGSYQTAGGLPLNGIASWDGEHWASMGSGLVANNYIFALASFDADGGGPNPALLYVGGEFNSINGVQATRMARWNGSTWAAVPGGAPNSSVLSFHVHDEDVTDASPPALYMGGLFTQIGSQPLFRVAAFNGVNWTALGTGLEASTPTLGLVKAGCMASMPTADGLNRLFVGGIFNGIDLLPLNGVALWFDNSWHPFTNGVNGPVGEIIVVSPEDKAGDVAPGMYITGSFSRAGPIAARGIARWDGLNWQNLGPGLMASVGFSAFWDTEITDSPIFDQASLIVGGKFDVAGILPVNNIARWDGSDWNAIGGGVDGIVLAIAMFDEDGDGPMSSTLFVGGGFDTAGGESIPYLARWDGKSWASVGGGVDDNVTMLKVIDDDGDGPNQPSLFVSGRFETVGGKPIFGLARWNGTEWSTLGNGVWNVKDALYWPGAPNSSLPSGLYVTGQFDMAGGSPANSIARWNGTQWLPLGSGLLGGCCPPPASSGNLAIVDINGTRPDGASLFVGGSFTTAGSLPAPGIARWDGAQWHSVGIGVMNYDSAALGVGELAWERVPFDGQWQQRLIVGGNFIEANGILSAHLTTWGCTDIPEECLADIAPVGSPNGTVNVEDLLAVIGAWGPCGNPNNCPADIAPPGGNDVVNVADLLAVIGAWGACP